PDRQTSHHGQSFLCCGKKIHARKKSSFCYGVANNLHLHHNRCCCGYGVSVRINHSHLHPRLHVRRGDDLPDRRTRHHDCDCAMTRNNPVCSTNCHSCHRHHRS